MAVNVSQMLSTWNAVMWQCGGPLSELQNWVIITFWGTQNFKQLLSNWLATGCKLRSTCKQALEYSKEQWRINSLVFFQPKAKLRPFTLSNCFAYCGVASHNWGLLVEQLTIPKQRSFCLYLWDSVYPVYYSYLQIDVPLWKYVFLLFHNTLQGEGCQEEETADRNYFFPFPSPW